ncbi:MAG: hypothetical protein J1E40_01740 [Oscillospiraceae bacterium]|nr:hypothetical protein [Oscillospiraceae bacterium]
MFDFLKKNKPASTGSVSSANTQSLSGIKQPVQPDDFFARPEKPKAAEAPKASETKQASGSVPVEQHATEIDTETLDTDKILYEQEQASAATRKPVEKTQSIETETIDTEKILYEQEQASAANRKPIEKTQGIETEAIDTEKILYEQEQASAANRKPIEKTQSIDTETLDTDRILYEQEQASAANAKVITETEGIDTSTLDMDELNQFQFSGGEDEEEDDIFDYSNDLDYGEITAAEIELT